MSLIKKQEMCKLIEMIKKTSRVSAFVLQALVYKSYPKNLYWMEGRIGDLAFCLECPSVRNKEEWTEDVQKIFMDYTAFTARSKAEDSGKRSVLLNALNSKSSRYIKLDEDESTSHRKYCNFTKAFEILANSKLLEILSCNAAPMQTTENSSISIVNVLEDFMSRSTFIESIPTSIESPNTTVTLYASEYDLKTIILGMDTSQHCEQVDAIPMETESFVPNIGIMEATVDPLSFYDEVSPTASSCSVDGNLMNGEPSTSLSVSDESSMEYPANYDPLADFLCSQEKTKIPPQKPVESDLNLSKKVNSSFWDIHDIHRIKYLGNQVRIIEQMKMDSCCPLLPSDQFMLTLKAPI